MKSNSEVFHRAHHSERDSGQSGNVSFAGVIGKAIPRRLYSYATCIGERFAGVCLVSARSYSNSTAKHITGFRRASPVPVVAIGGNGRGSSGLLVHAHYGDAWAEYVGEAMESLSRVSPRAFRQRAAGFARLRELVDGWEVFHSATGIKGGRGLSSMLRLARGVLASEGATQADYVKRKEAAEKRREAAERRRISAALASVGGLDGVRALFVRDGRSAASAALDAAGLSWSDAFPPSLPDLLFVDAAGESVTSQGVFCLADTLGAYRAALSGAQDVAGLAWGAPVRDDATGLVRVGCHRFTVEHLRDVGVLS